MFAEIKQTISRFNPSQKQLRVFGITLALFLGLLFFLTDKPPYLLFGAGALLVAFVAPTWYLPPLKALMVVAVPVGLVLSRLLLVLFFFIVMASIGLLIRFIGKDPLMRRVKPDVSFWQEVEANEHPKSVSL